MGRAGVAPLHGIDSHVTARAPQSRRWTPGPAATPPEAEAFVNLWLAGLGQYFRDARGSLRGMKNGGDGGAALADLHGERILLANLCAPLGLDPDMVADAMLAGLAAGRRWL